MREIFGLLLIQASAFCAEAPQSVLQRSMITLSGITHRTFSSDGTDYWTAANPAYQNPFAVDLWYVFHGYPKGFTTAQIDNIIDKFLAVKNGNGIPPTFLNSDATAGNYPPTGAWDSVWFLPHMEQLVYQESGSISHFSTNAAAYKTMIQYMRANCSGSQNLMGGCGHYWGFHDGLASTGNDLWGSLLFYQTCKILSSLSTTAGNASDAAYYTTQSGLISSNIAALLDSGGSGMFDAASGTNTQIDVLGSAYAAYIGIVSQSAANSISIYLVQNYGTLTRSGFVKMTPADWGSCACNGSGNYQQGFWSVGNEWVAYALAITSTSTAVRLINDLVSGAQYTLEYLGATMNGQTNNFASPAGSLAWINSNLSLFPIGINLSGMNIQGLSF